MRNDFYYEDYVPKVNAKKVSRRRAKKSLLTGCILGSMVVGFWQLGLLLIGVLGFADYVQKRW